MKKSLTYAIENRDKFINELFDLLRIPSVSAQSNHKGDMTDCAGHLRNSLIAAGADYAEVSPSEGNQVVFGHKIIDSNLPTVLIYAHYDVMPVEPLEQWHSDPFSPEIRNGKIYGRGADDDKGQGFMHIKAFESMVRSGELPCNVKFMLEGEEEIGSPSLKAWCEKHKEELAADVILISDTSMISWECPSITCGLRGLTYMEVEVEGPSHDLHSGLYGGTVANPAQVLTKMVASLVDDKGRITIPGFYDDVKTYTAAERAEISKAPFSVDEYLSDTGSPTITGEEGYNTIERRGIRPALDINGIWSGYQGEGSKTIIPATASAKISMRLVPNQDYRTIGELFEKYFKSIAPEGVRVNVKYHHGGATYGVDTENKAYKAAVEAIKDTFGVVPLPMYSGGSIPIVSTFEQVLGIKSLLLGFGLGSDAIHSPNESYPLDNFYKGIDTIINFYKHFSR